MSKSDPLKTYKAKRNFSVTNEPKEGGIANDSALAFVVQKHWASHLHYDFRLELDGTMKSWAIPKGPSLDTHVKRMAVHVEDHPISYNTFEGRIPAGQYGSGKVIIWDKGIWRPLSDARKGYKQGTLKFELSGQKLRGKWALIKMKGKSDKQEPWLLIKENDKYAQLTADFSVVDEMPDSVAEADAIGAVQEPLPDKLKPELATLVDTPPADSENWMYEIKFDGYRILARIKGKDIKLFTRNGNDWTAKLAGLSKALKKMTLPDGWYDGEIVVMNKEGIPDFQALQNAIDSDKTQEIIYYLFDLPYCDGWNLMGMPLVERRRKLQELLSEKDNSTVRFSDTFNARGSDIVASACKLGLEGVIGKRKGSIYVPKRSLDWIKLKCSLRQEFVIGGYTEPKGARLGIGSLLLGVHDESGALRYVGNVGTGFNNKTLVGIRSRLNALDSKLSPFATDTRFDGQKARWVEPSLMAEVSFAQWTQAGLIRHSVFHGLRSDKPAKDIMKETGMPASKHSRSDSIIGKLKITHPERVVDSTTGITKIDLLRYYALVAPLMLDHLKARPVSLVRAPEGIKGQMFFQKHLEMIKMTGVRALPQRLDPGHEPLMEVVTPQGLLNAAQMNVVEFHTWNAVKSNIGRPDRMTFDLDPGEGVKWSALQDAALVLRVLLNELELIGFVKTSGGKGLHVVVPLQRRYDWDTVKDFSYAIVAHLAKTFPRRFVAKSGPRNRVGKIFIDYLRNGFGATTVAAWSARARPGMGVSVPVAWNEVESLKSAAQWHVSNIHERLDVGNEPWQEYSSSAETLTAAMKILGYKHGK